MVLENVTQQNFFQLALKGAERVQYQRPPEFSWPEQKAELQIQGTVL